MWKPRRLLRLILDFDGTVTKKDTLSIVAQSGYSSQRNSKGPKPVTQWTEIVEAYVADFNKHLQAYIPASDLRRTLPQEFHWLNSLAAVEASSAERAERAGIFDDVSAKEIAGTATRALDTNEIRLRPGWADLVKQVLSLNHSLASEKDDIVEPVHIISVNWSRWFIWCVLDHASQKSALCGDVLAKEIDVYANEIPSVARDLQDQHNGGHLPGGKVSQLRTSGDKLAQLLALRSRTPSPGFQVCSIYVGDSTTDLQCLATADIGICIRDEPMSGGQKDLSDTCERLNIRVKHLTENTSVQSIHDRFPGNDQTSLWWSRDFEEISFWVQQHVM